jgi:hypothetical protein
LFPLTDCPLHADCFTDVVALQVTSQIVGKQGLLQRVAHSAALHPGDPQTILVYGGFTDLPNSKYLDTFVSLNTARYLLPAPSRHRQIDFFRNKSLTRHGPVVGGGLLTTV